MALRTDLVNSTDMVDVHAPQHDEVNQKVLDVAGAHGDSATPGSTAHTQAHKLEVGTATTPGGTFTSVGLQKRLTFIGAVVTEQGGSRIDVLISAGEALSDLGDVSGTVPISLAAGAASTLVRARLVGNTTFTFPTSLPPGVPYSFSLLIRQDGTGGRTVTWPGGVVWNLRQVGSMLSGPSKQCWFTFTSVDAGTTWIGALVMEDIG